MTSGFVLHQFCPFADHTVAFISASILGDWHNAYVHFPSSYYLNHEIMAVSISTFVFLIVILRRILFVTRFSSLYSCFFVTFFCFSLLLFLSTAWCISSLSLFATLFFEKFLFRGGVRQDRIWAIRLMRRWNFPAAFLVNLATWALTWWEKIFTHVYSYILAIFRWLLSSNQSLVLSAGPQRWFNQVPIVRNTKYPSYTE